jgi:peptidoglycan hydrolase-like protein with peptidoglycan-binding domain
MTTHLEARKIAHEALLSVFGTTTSGEIKHLAAIACLETQYGQAWKGAGAGSNNMGAVQAGGWKGDTFQYTDSRPLPNGTSEIYAVKFRKYQTTQAGWEDLAKVAYLNCGRNCVREAAIKDDTFSVSEKLYNTRYYEGFGATPEARIRGHYNLLVLRLRQADVEAYNASHASQIPRTLKRGDQGEEVRLLQQHLGIAADGLFGEVTRSTVMAFQRARGLQVDGVVGPETWLSLLK